MENLTFTNPKGLTLAAHLWETPGDAAVVLVHGFCNDKASNGMAPTRNNRAMGQTTQTNAPLTTARPPAER